MNLTAFVITSTICFLVGYRVFIYLKEYSKYRQPHKLPGIFLEPEEKLEERLGEKSSPNSEVF